MSRKNLSTTMDSVPSKYTPYCYAIDFGTTNSTVAICDETGLPITIPVENASGNSEIVRSIIYISPNHEFQFGSDAITAYIKDVAEGRAKQPKLIWTGKYINIAEFSPTAGFKGEKPIPEIIEVEVGSDGRLLQSLKTALSISSYSKFNIFGKEYAIEYLIGLFLKNLKNEADKFTNSKIDNLVLGRPVHFIGDNDTLAEERLKEAAKIAGFKKIFFEYEPVGAAWNYGLVAKNKKLTVLIFDFGGGTLDFSIVKFPDKKILSNFGLPIGGDLFNSRLFGAKISKYFGSQARFGTQQLPLPTHIFKSLENWYMISLLKTRRFIDSLENLRYLNTDPQALNNLKNLIVKNLGFSLYEEIDRVKKELSLNEVADFSFNNGGIDIYEIIRRKDLEYLIDTDLGEIKKGINTTVTLANLNVSQIDYVVTTGGSSLIPIVSNLLTDMFGHEKVFSQNPFTSVALGLALKGKEIKF